MSTIGVAAPDPERVLVLACGALARELAAIVSANDLTSTTIECLPASLHNDPDAIPAAVEARLDRAEGVYERVLLGYADCGTGGRLDEVCQRRGVTRLPGAHCYEFFAGSQAFAELHDEEPGTFYLTDYLARHFDRLVIQMLGIDRHPELEELYFANYQRVVLLSQTEDPAVLARARAAAERLGLRFEHHPTGYGRLRPQMVEFAVGAAR